MAAARENLAEARVLFFDTATTEEIDRRIRNEVHVTQIEVSVA
ncbi:MAG: hypothetical protein OXE84_07220 [Rhodobacteraceae bacterium]|nr:hypothetical protein [Paracoccaceae bacterium]MCY4197645.1 hypothetical protein [Paracoccaceae bacterium]